MKLTSILTLCLLVLSCGGGNSSGETEPQNPSIPLDPDKIHIQIRLNSGNYLDKSVPLPGITVQLDADGVNKVSDANGFVTFDISDANSHDFHVFPTISRFWESHYDVAKGEMYTILISDKKSATPATPSSSLVFSGAITGVADSNSYQYFFYETNGTVREGKITPQNTNAEYKVKFNYSYPVGQKVTGKFLVQEFRYDAISGETRLVDSMVVGDFSTMTSNNDTATVVQNIDFARTKPPVSDIISVNELNVPTGLTTQGITIGAASQDKTLVYTRPIEDLYRYDRTNLDLVFPNLFKSYSSFNYPKVSFRISASKDFNTYNLTWDQNSIITRNDTISINPVITVLPEFPINQSGLLITWNKIDPNIDSLYLSINSLWNEPKQVHWNLKLNPKATSVRLPMLPASMTPLLNLNQKYQINLTGYYRKSKTGKQLREQFTLTTENWSR